MFLFFITNQVRNKNHLKLSDLIHCQHNLAESTLIHHKQALHVIYAQDEVEPEANNCFSICRGEYQELQK